MSTPKQQPMNPQLQINAYLDTQFLFYMFPCYYAVVVFLYRYYSLIQIPKKYYVKPIYMQNIFTFLLQQTHEVPEMNENNINNMNNMNNITNNINMINNQQIQLPYKKLTPSFIIKYKVSLWNSFLYLIMIILSFFTSHDLFYAAKHKYYALLYIFGSLSWYLSAYIIKKQYQRDINQSLWTHRFFWIFCSVFSISKMFQDYFLPINFIVNVLFLIINIQLAIYGLYRPQDNETVDMIRSQDTPQFVKRFFATLQLNPFIRFLFDIQDYTRQSFNQNQQYNYNNTETPLDSQQFTIIDQQTIKQIQSSFCTKKTAQSIRDQINLMNTLPRRNIFIDKKLRYIKENDIFKPYYFILTQIGDVRFQAQRKYKEFIMLEEKLLNVFNVKYFPKNQVPRIIDIIKKNHISTINLSTPINSLADISQQFSSKPQILQQYLQQLIKQPLFMIPSLLSFLSIDQQKSAPFITYFQFTYKSFCTKLYIIQKYKQQKNQQQQIRQSFIQYQNQSNEKDQYDINNRKINEEKQVNIKKIIKNKLEFVIQVNKDIIDEKQYGFWITCYVQKKDQFTNKIKDKQFNYNNNSNHNNNNNNKLYSKNHSKPITKWLIRKFQQNILQINQRIQDQCKLSIPFYYQILSSMTNPSHKSKSLAYKSYLQKLLQSDKYYCLSLFQFIRFDPIKLQPKLLNTEISFSNSNGSLFNLLQKNEKNIQSRYFQMWEDKGEFIEVLRIDKITMIQGNDKNLNVQDVIPELKQIHTHQNNMNNDPFEYKFTVRRKGTTLRNKSTKQLIILHDKLSKLYKGIHHVPILEIKQCTKQQVKNKIQKFLLKIESLPKIQINNQYKKFYQNSI